MHFYGQWPEKHFSEVEEAASFIGNWLRKWGRVPVMQTKEKFGTVRVYCSLGWRDFHDIFYPGYYRIVWSKKIQRINLFLCYTFRLGYVLGFLSLPVHKRLYRWRYKKALQKWPHLKDEILSCADFGQLLC